jgi:hypothetical protein
MEIKRWIWIPVAERDEARILYDIGCDQGRQSEQPEGPMEAE